MERIGVDPVGPQNQRPEGPDIGARSGYCGTVVGAVDVVGQHIAANARRVLADRHRIVGRLGDIVDDRYIEAVARGRAVGVGDGHQQALGRRVVRRRSIGHRILKQIGVAHRAAGIGAAIPVDGQLALQRVDHQVGGARRRKLRITERLSTNGDARDPVGRGHREGAGLGQCADVRRGPVRQIVLVNRLLVAGQAADRDNVVGAEHRYGQCRVGGNGPVRRGIGELFGNDLAAVEPLNQGPASAGRVQCVGVGTVGTDHQLPIGAVERPGGSHCERVVDIRVGDIAAQYAVRSAIVRVRGQHIAARRGTVLDRKVRVGIDHRRIVGAEYGDG